ncbi:hypothetical protein HF086_000444 [Spodoptera exigua]|uniref:Endonuclease/exonuclease/phosphatase domain-containing protein n=1 Tax=Spodoptera exigua TaxID=7107 RepID=A0A922MYU1_SPOEX|nr:hypothetical protein HF086_000444 [Spodoptera exigua]
MATSNCKLISYNCKSIKRSIEGVRDLCKIGDVIALQETWLMPYDLSILGTIDGNFGSTGTSAVDTSAGLLTGRPYGGVALLWRKSAFDSVSVIKCNNVRVTAIKITVSSRCMVVFSVYMPTNSVENIPLFTECLGTVRSIIEYEENLGVETFYILGDFNAHPDEIFYNELLNFCNDYSWCCADVTMLGFQSDTFTYRSDSHRDCVKWLDHALVTQSALTTVNKVWVKYDVFWSDHFPLIVECNWRKVNKRM